MLRNYKIGVVGDEVTLAGMQQLATFQLNGEQIKMLSGGMLDLLVQQKGMNATQQDAVGIPKHKQTIPYEQFYSVQHLQPV